MASSPTDQIGQVQVRHSISWTELLGIIIFRGSHVGPGKEGLWTLSAASHLGSQADLHGQVGKTRWDNFTSGLYLDKDADADRI